MNLNFKIVQYITVTAKFPSTNCLSRVCPVPESQFQRARSAEADEDLSKFAKRAEQAAEEVGRAILNTKVLRGMGWEGRR